MMKYIFTVIMRPHTWFELETVDFSVKKYLYWDEYSEIFLPSPAFYSWIPDNYSRQGFFRLMNKLRWQDLKHCKEITKEIEQTGQVNINLLSGPVFYNEHVAKNYFQQLQKISGFVDYKVLSIYATVDDVRKASLNTPTNNRVLTTINWKEIYDKKDNAHQINESSMLGFDIQNMFDFGRNLRYHIASIAENYSALENGFGLLNHLESCYKIINEIDLNEIKASSCIEIDGVQIPCYQTKEEWMPIGIMEI